MEARPGDVWLSGLPLFHIGGVNGVLPFIYLAGHLRHHAVDQLRPPRVPAAAREAPGDDVLLRTHPVAADLLAPGGGRHRTRRSCAGPCGGRPRRHPARLAPGSDVLRPWASSTRSARPRCRRTPASSRPTMPCARWVRSAFRPSTSRSASSTTSATTSPVGDVGEIVYRGPDGDEGLLQEGRGHARTPSGVAGSTAATWCVRTTRASSTSSTGSRT